MSVAADSYEAKLSAAFVDMLAASAEFRAAVGAGDAAAAKRRIVEDDAGASETPTASDGSPIDLLTSYGVVSVGAMQRESRALFSYGRSGTVLVELWLRIAEGEDAASAVRQARNRQGLIAAQIEAQADGNGRPPRIEIETAEPQIMDEQRSRAGFVRCALDCAWSDLP